MVTAKFFGMISVDNNLKNINIKEGTVKDAINEIAETTTIDKKQLEQAVIVVNNNFKEGKARFKTHLKSGDEVIFMSPVCGG